MILEEIVARVRQDLEERRRSVPLGVLERRARSRRPLGLARALSGPGRRIIAEVKRASPSRGVLREDFDPVALARGLGRGGACALSVLTEERFFQGSLAHLEAIRAAVALPLLRKDFVLDPYQLFETRAFGADATLLIVAVLERGLLRELYREAERLELETLVEVHAEEELEAALSLGARLIGINHRDLKTFRVDLEASARLLPRIPPGKIVVAESGLEAAEELRRLERLGVSAFLVGESLMRAPDPEAKLRELLS
jgi:indole-3-glycerol phosphate synthase